MISEQIEQSFALHWNLNGFYNKFAHLQHIISTYNPSIFALNETRHDNKKTKLKFKGYEIIEKSGTLENDLLTHGGVALMIKENFHFKKIEINVSLQIVAVQIFFPIKMTFASIYIPPNKLPSDDELDEIERILPKPFVLVGDVNSRHTEWKSSYSNQLGKKIMNFVQKHDLVVINDDQVTRVGAHGESAMIDLVIVTGDLQNIFEVETTKDFFESDHKLIKIDTIRKLVETRSPNFNFKKADWKKFEENTKLCEIDLNSDIDSINTNIVNNIINSANSSIPKFSINFKSEKCKAWWNNKIDEEYKKMIKLNRKIRREKNSYNFNQDAIKMHKSVFNKQRAIFRELRDENRKKEMEKFSLQITKDTSNRVLWKKIKAEEGKRSKTKTIYIYDEETDECIINKQEIAERLSVSFLDNFKNDSNVIVNENVVRIVDEKDAEYLNDDFTMKEMLKQIKKAKITSPGEDKISYVMIKNLNFKDKKFLLDFYNKTWQAGKSPKDWKKSLVIAIPKEIGEKHNIKKYRPIQLCSVISKIKENMVACRLNYHMEVNHLNHKNQNGFRAKRSTADNLMIFEDRIRSALNKTREVIVIFFDIQKAFDSVKSSKIIECLKEMGIHGKMLEYSEDFFKDRKYQVKFENELSSEKSQENGVPQGSGVSVQYFKIVMDQLKYFIDSENIYLFVDDFVYMKTISRTDDPEKVRNEIQKEIKKIEKWSTHFGLKISSAKTKIMKFTKKRNPSEAPKITINAQEIEEVKTNKFLGVIFETKLKYDKYINELVKRINNDLNVIKALTSYKLNLRRETLLQVLDVKVKSKIDYASFLFQHESKKNIKKLIVKYNQGLRICLGAYRTCNVRSLYAEAGKISLTSSADKKAMKYVVGVLGNSEHPLRNDILEKINNTRQEESKKKKPSALVTACKRVKKLKLNKVEAVKPYFNRPSWLKSRVKVDKKVHVCKKDSENPSTWQKIFNEKSAKYDKQKMIFTDGSLKDGKVAWAVTSEEDLIKSGRIHDKSSILSAEMRAVVEAGSGSNDEDPIIVTDSLSTANMLLNNDDKNNNCRYLVNKLNKAKKNITIMWCPSHQNIKGNETADKFAVEALEKPTNNFILENDAKKFINNSIIQAENKEWSEVSDRNNLRKLKDNIQHLKFPENMKRKDQVIISRLRTGCTKYTDEWKFHKTTGHIGQACQPCATFTSIEHIFGDCKVYEGSRKKFNVSFKDLNNTNKFNDIIDFLKDIDLYDKI